MFFVLCLMFVIQAAAQEVPAQPSPSQSPAPQISPSQQAAPSAQPTPLAPSDQETQSAQPPTLVPADFPAYQFSVRKTAAYHLEYKSISKADLRVLFEGQNAGQAQASGLSYALSASAEGEMEVTTTHVTAERVENFYRVRAPDVHLVVNGNPQTAQATEVVGELTRGFLVELTPEGNVTAIYLSPDAGKFPQDFVRTLLAALQFVLPASSPGESGAWTTTEADRNGAYVARYRISNSPQSKNTDVVLIHKSKLRYLPEPSVPAGEEMPGRTPARKKVTSKMNFEARFQSATGQLASLNGTETQETAVQDKNVAHSETIVRLTHLSSPKFSSTDTERVMKMAAGLRDNSSRLMLFAQRSPKEIDSNIQRTELGAATAGELLTRLSTMGNNLSPDKQEAAETPLYLKFKALVYVHPEACAQLGQVLAQADLHSPSFRILSYALGAVGHREAQTALVAAIARRPGDSAALASLIATLGGAPHPTKESEEALREIALNSPDPNVADAAILGLGSMARSLARVEPGRSTTVVEFLLQRATTNGSNEQKQAAVQAIGNSASSRAMPLLAKLANDDSPAMRATALDALRSIPEPQVDPLLRKSLASDAEPRVRLEAAFALGFRKTSLESFNAQKKVLATESDEKVRGALLDNLAKMHRQYPEVRSIMVRASKNDPSEYVRKEATGLLGQLQAASPRHK